MSYTARLSELLYPLAFHVPLTRDAVNDSAWVSLSNYHRAWLVVNVGAMEQGATLDVSIRQAEDAIGTNAKAITGKAITQLTQVSGDGNGLVCIELQTEELDVDGGFEHVQFRVTCGPNWVTYSAILYGCSARFKPVATTNWDEIVG